MEPVTVRLPGRENATGAATEPALYTANATRGRRSGALKRFIVSVFAAASSSGVGALQGITSSARTGAKHRSPESGGGLARAMWSTST